MQAISTIPFSRERRAWPDQASAAMPDGSGKELLRQAILTLRIGETLLSETLFLAAILKSESPDAVINCLECLAGLQLRQLRIDACESLIHQAEGLIQPKGSSSRAVALRRHQLNLAKYGPVRFEPGVSDPGAMDPLERLEQIQSELLTSEPQAIAAMVDAWPSDLTCPEAIELRARALKALGRHQEAFELFCQLLNRCSGSAATWTAVLELNLLNQRNNGLALATATRLHPQDPGIASHQVLILLQDRQPALARRAAYKERLLYSLGKRCPSRHQSDGNLIACYDQTGRADLTPYLHHSLLGRLAESPPLHANVTMQLASQASALYGRHAEQHAATFPSKELIKSRSSRKPLRVGLVSPDLYYHPVGRFIQMLLAGGFGKPGELHLINTGRAASQRLQELSGPNLHHVTASPLEEQRANIRALDLDIAVDLAGWTGDNNGPLFASGLAPLQVNYLGFFASSGLNAMDVWLGDHALFPDPMQEWHSERIVRLKRPFLAWQPDSDLPEGNVAVPPAPSGPITFGCFNHVRKLSHGTLSLWGKLLREIRGSRLALKAFTTDDPGVVELIEKRMHRCGLDPEAVIWLPTAPKPEDHLRQYGLIDVALDPFPNGGCTTTCEALWMGVPVITLCGSHYVSRMATAVLQGAQLPEWVAISQDDYLQLAIRAAEQLPQIRAGRAQLRSHLQHSPLGNAADLAEHLWQCFEGLA